MTMEKRRRLEAAKTIIIVCLTASAIFLGTRDGVLGGVPMPVVTDIIEWFSHRELASEVTEEPETHTAVLPLYAVITDENGGHCGIKYNSSELRAMYDKIGNLFGEALGSARHPELVSETELQAALSGESIFFDYVNPAYVSVISSWLGTEVSEDISVYTARRLCVAAQGGNVMLYIKDAHTGAVYRADTAIIYRSLQARIREYTPNSAVFGFELEDILGNGDLYQFLLPETVGYETVIKSSPLKENGGNVDAVLQYFDVSSYVNSRYTENDGTIVFVESDHTLRLNINNGTVILRRSKAGSGETGITAAIDMACGVVNDTVAKYSGDAIVCMSGVTQSENGYTVNFKYYINSSEITGSEFGAARAVIDGGEISELYLYFGSWTLSGRTVELLPEILAAAAAGDGELAIVYSDTADGEQMPEWIVR